MVFLAALTQLVYFYPEMIDQKFTVHSSHIEYLLALGITSDEVRLAISRENKTLF